MELQPSAPVVWSSASLSPSQSLGDCETAACVTDSWNRTGSACVHAYAAACVDVLGKMRTLLLLVVQLGLSLVTWAEHAAAELTLIVAYSKICVPRVCR